MNVLLRPSFKLLLLLGAFAALPWGAPSFAEPPSEPPTYIRYTEPDAPAVGEFAEERLRVDTEYHGTYRADRQLEQDQIVRGIVKTGKVVDRPRIIFTAGSMGSGKSRVLRTLGSTGYFDPNQFVLIDPDKIKELIPDYERLKGVDPAVASTLVHRESAFLQELAMEHSLSAGKNLIIDGSLRDTEYFSLLIERIRKAHPRYLIEIVHILVDPEKADARQKARALVTGRVVPDSLFRASVEQSAHSVEVLSSAVDRVVRIDNNDHPMIIDIAEGNKHLLPQPLYLVESSRRQLRNLKPRLTPPKEPQGVQHVVLDLDWGAFSPVPEGARVDPSRVIEVQGKHYYLPPGIREAVTAWVHDPDLRLSFFSGGSYSRNMAALKQIHLTDGSGRSFYDAAYRILSHSDLTVVPNVPVSARFYDRFKKDLRKISANLDNVVIIDDQKKLILQEDHALYIGEGYSVHERFDHAMDAHARGTDYERRYIPTDENEWLKDRFKIPGVFSVIDESLARARSGQGTFAKQVARLSDLPREAFVLRGLTKLGLRPGPGCVAEVERLLNQWEAAP